MPEFVEYAAVGCAGAASLELIKAYELRGKLHLATYRRLIRSPLFWLAKAGMIFASGFITWAYYAGGELRPTPWQLAIAGAACRSLVRGAIEARVANERTTLGEQNAERVDLRDAFR